MSTYRERRFQIRFMQFLVITVIGMFVVTVGITFHLLTNDNCKCPKQGYIKENKLVSTAQEKQVKYLPGHKLAVLVPFRDRFDELLEFAPYINNFLNEQHINHSIFILNQVDHYRFNRASLINVGYLYTRAAHDYIVMHDVDLLPLNKQLSYAYPKDQPFHIAAPDLHPRYHYSKFVGGILLVNREHFSLVDGMSNKYWGWGLEDDEFYVRLREANLNVTRPINITTGRNNTFKHIHNKGHRKRDTEKCYNQREVTRKRDRQTGLRNVKYKIVSVKEMTIEEVKVSVVNIYLFCDEKSTPWCDCSEKKTGNKTQAKSST